MSGGLTARLAALVACALAAYGIRHDSLSMPPPYWYAVAMAVGLYALSEHLWPCRHEHGPLRHGVDVLGRLGVIALFLTAAGYLLKISDVYSRLWSTYWLVSAWIVLGLMNTNRRRRRGRLILVGEPEAVQHQHASHAGTDDRTILCLSLSEALTWLEDRDAAGDTMRDTEILLVGAVPEPADRTALILALHGNPVTLRYCPDCQDIPGDAERFSVPLLPSPGPVDDALKRLEDLVLGGAALILCALPMLVTALMVAWNGPGPILFRQRRLGLGGQAFTIYKFRTMAPGAADDAEAPQAGAGDARVTRIGAILRHWGLDEMPQLFNVLRGDMSLVGPRPHAFPHDVLWGGQLPQYAQRFRMRPGITGLAQIRGRRGYVESIEDIKARLDLDLDYIRNWSLVLDLRILFGTLPALIRTAPSTAGQPTDD
jgi:Sugar transferases involved in lipopolysaccharide synthesis